MYDPPKKRGHLLALACLALLFASAASAQSTDDLKVEAWEAQRSAEEAERLEAEAREAVAQAERRAAEAREKAAEAQRRAEAAADAPFTIKRLDPAAASAEAAGVPPTGASAEAVEELRSEVREAREAAARAEAEVVALREELAERHAQRYARPGLYLSAGLAWAPELFSTDFSVDNGESAWAAVGYRVVDRFEFEVRLDRVTNFGVEGFGLDAELEGYAATLNGRFFLTTGRVQPYLGVGLGAMRFEGDGELVDTGERIKDRETELVFRPSVGVDLYLTENVAITGEAAMFNPSGDLSHLRWATLGAGVKLRF